MSREGGRLWSCPPGTVLVATDFGEASARALSLGAMIASAHGATLRALHAERFEAPAYFTVDQIARLEAERRAARTSALAHLRAVAAGVTDYPIEASVVDAPPVEAILDAAASADLVVAGTHGRRGPGRWWLGSVAERVVRGADVPVLVARADMGPARAVFDRIVLAGGEGGGAKAYAAYLAATFGSVVEDAGRWRSVAPALCAGPRWWSSTRATTAGSRPSTRPACSPPAAVRSCSCPPPGSHEEERL